MPIADLFELETPTEPLPQVTKVYGRQSPLNEFMIILVFYEITKTNLTLALGTYKAKNDNDVTGKVAFHVSKKAPMDVTINANERK